MMKGKELNEIRNKRGPLLCIVLSAFLILTGCASFGSISLNKAVIKYDNTVLQSEQEILLLNIIRMHYDQPPHFTAASSIAATFTLSYAGGSNSSFTNNTKPANSPAYTSASGLTLGATVSENPTITITPMQGKDFAQRLLQPIDTKFVSTILLQQGGNKIDKMLRLISSSFYMVGPKDTKSLFERISKDLKEKTTYGYPFTSLEDQLEGLSPEQSKTLEKKNNQTLKDLQVRGGFTDEEAKCLLGDRCFIENKPSIYKLSDTSLISAVPLNDTQTDEWLYGLFRKIVLHLKTLVMGGGAPLMMCSLDFDVPNEGITGTLRNDLADEEIKDTINLFEKQYYWKEVTQGKGFIVQKRYSINAITDFDFANLSHSDKEEILTKIQKDLDLNEHMNFGESVIIVLLRGDKDNRWPIYGFFTVRNFRQVLQFLAESLIINKPGYEIEKDVMPSKFTEDC